MAMDESFKRPGAIPFKWEVRPGVPKPLPKATRLPSHSHGPPCMHLSPPPVASIPPSYSPSSSPLLLRAGGRSPSDRWRFQRQVLDHTRADSGSPRFVEQLSPGCFVIPPMNRKEEKKKTNRPEMVVDEDGDEDDIDNMVADLKTLARWSMSTRKSLSPDSPPLLSSLSSSIRRGEDSDWASYGLF